MPGSGMTLAPIPDGMGVYGSDRHPNLMMTHELDVESVECEAAYARVSKLAIDLQTLAIVDHDHTIQGIS